MATIQSLPSFASPISIVNFGNAVKELNKQLILDIDDKLSKQTRDEHSGSFRGESAQTGLSMQQEYDSFKTLEQIIQPAYEQAMADYGYHPDYIKGNTVLEEFWGNRTDNGGWSLAHWHGVGNTLWAGVYYPMGFDDPEDLDELNLKDYIFNWLPKSEPDGHLIIEDPALFVKGQIAPFHSYHILRPDHFALRKYIKPREGMLVLFPAWQNHSVSPTPRKRYSISFAINKRSG